MESEEGKGSIFSFHVWIELPEECQSCVNDSITEDSGQNEAYGEVQQQMMDEQAVIHKLQSLTESRVGENVWKYGEPKNKEELEKKMSKLILSVEMENWEKAEMFAETVKQLVEEAPREVKSAALRMKMAVQKGDYEKSTAAYEILQKLI